MTPEDKLIATELLEKVNQWIDSIQEPKVIEGVNKFCFGTRRDLDVKNEIASQDDIEKILELGQQNSCLYSTWINLMEEAKCLRRKLKNVIECETEYD